MEPAVSHDDNGLSRLLETQRNWGRWGTDDQRGTLNLVDAKRCLAGVAAVRQGRVVSLARTVDRNIASGAKSASIHTREERDAGIVVDGFHLDYHGQAVTHIDAIGHVWSGGQLWNGRDPGASVNDDRLLWSDTCALMPGIVTRGVLLDIPGLRGEPCVTQKRPVEAEDLIQAAASQGVELCPGDGMVIYSGREEWDSQGHQWGKGPARPGVAASCVSVIRQWDTGVVLWDMADARPNEFGATWTVHRAIAELGLPLIDNAVLSELSGLCRSRGVWEFLLVLAPIPVKGSTGSPINPLAIL